MKAVIFERFGGPLQVADVAKPSPGTEEVLIRVAYAGVNPVDNKIHAGMLERLFPHHFPIILGWDVAGTVVECGPGTHFHVGDRVFAYCRKPEVQWGAFAEYVTVNEKSVAHTPRTITDRDAAAIPLTALTAWQAIFDFAGLTRDTTLLVHAGAGGVGGMALQFARHAGAKRIYTTASEANHDYVRSLGAHVAIDYREEDFMAHLRDKEPQGVDILLDCVGGATLERSYDLVKPGGVLVSIVDMPDADRAEKCGIKKSGFVFVTPSGELLSRIANLLEEGELLVPEVHEMPLDQAARAMEMLDTRHVRGKIVLSVAP